MVKCNILYPVENSDIEGRKNGRKQAGRRPKEGRKMTKEKKEVKQGKNGRKEAGR